MNRFNIRVYALIFNTENQVLLCEETHRNKHMIKFPGGGMEWGESPIDCLKRELMEEFSIRIVTAALYYVTDFFQVSYFNPNDQVVSIYYTCKIQGNIIANEPNVTAHWFNLEELTSEKMTFPIDKHVVGLIKKELRQNDN
jgi:ADP-ribose pyrophosphatase YjhB (NUDIX family)